MAWKVGVWVNYLLSTLGFVEVNFSFFLKVLIISTNFWVLYRTINIRHICSLYHSLVHSSTPQQPMTPSLCGSSTHHPRILISHSFVFVQLPVHLFNHIETWVVLYAWPVTKKEKRKTGIWHVEIDKKIAKNDMTENFIKRDPNYSSGEYQISKKFWNRFINTDLPNSR